jgi:hypothetical protein
MPVEEGFKRLAHDEPALLEAAQEVVRVAETARGHGRKYTDVRGAVDEVVARALRMVGPAAIGKTGLVATSTASQVVTYRLYDIADVSVYDFRSNDWPGGA